ncbi:kinase-like domain-containing protein [Halenospora varia]|nr:kinase-like domain-containing protein [Halenospora varia]
MTQLVTFAPQECPILLKIFRVLKGGLTDTTLTTGTKVALKKYHSTSSQLQSDDSNANKRLRQPILQELKVFCHPSLKTHENICKLLFIGWESNNLIPSLALELGCYGTLVDCLQPLRSYSSDIRKAHLTLDIALGLGAIYSRGLVHGDIKSSNIIIQEHPTRSIVAKISDFNGVSRATTYGSTQYSVGTPLWQAPDILNGEPEIDWQISDVYSFGMVVATIRCSSGFISTLFVPRYLLDIALKSLKEP